LWAGRGRARTGDGHDGGWSHAYIGAITNSGRLLGPVNGCSPTTPNCQLVNERGGAGTLTDGAFSSVVEDQLLIAGSDAQGVPFSPTITLHLGQRTKVQQIRIFGGGSPFNAIPGALEAATVTIGASRAALTTVQAGDIGPLGFGADDILDLRGTGLETVSTTDVVCTRTHEFVSGSAAYQALPAQRRAAVDAQVEAGCAKFNAIVAGMSPRGKAALVAAYKATVDVLVRKRFLTAEQAATLKGLADQI
jgi:hypothetical protein